MVTAQSYAVDSYPALAPADLEMADQPENCNALGLACRQEIIA